MVPFAGYEMPVQYRGVLDETKACRKSMGLFDVSHMGQLSLRGEHPLRELQRLVTNDLSKLALHQAQYNLLCNPEGGVIDDIIVYRRTEEEVFICVNASNRLIDYAWMKEHLPSSVSLEDQSDQTGLIAIQGPQAEHLMSTLISPSLVQNLKYYWALDTHLDNIPVFLSRTGYTGEDGFELYLRERETEKVWNLLLEKGASFGITPCGLGARDTLRLEMGYPLHGHELSQEISPLQAGLFWAVKLETPWDFVGKQALVRQKTEGAPTALKPLTLLDKRIPRQGYEIVTTSHEMTGSITSGTFSPHLNRPIALGFVNRRHASETQFAVKVRNDLISAQVTSIPFVPSKVKKNTVK